MTDVRISPDLDEVEISIFGPGVGECVVVHLGNGDWMVVDSCINKLSKRPVALDYFNVLGVDVSTAIRLLVASHWHDDHIRGIAKVCESAQLAKIACSVALKSREFINLAVASPYAMFQWPGASEMREVLKICSSRKSSARAAGPEWAASSMRLLTLAGSDRPFTAEVTSLSPSAETITFSFRAILEEFFAEGRPVRQIPDQSPNEISVVLWIKLGTLNVLLGADLEERNHPGEGWRAIVQSDTRPSDKAQVFKVPHHGSTNADLQEVWDEMLVPSPHAVVTPYVRGPKVLPSRADLERLCSRTSNVYCTGDPESWKSPKRERTVDKVLKKIGPKRRAIEGRMGQVRIRSKNSLDDIRVDLFQGAANVCNT